MSNFSCDLRIYSFLKSQKMLDFINEFPIAPHSPYTCCTRTVLDTRIRRGGCARDIVTVDEETVGARVPCTTDSQELHEEKEIVCRST